MWMVERRRKMYRCLELVDLDHEFLERHIDLMVAMALDLSVPRN